MIWATGDCHGNFERFRPEYFPEQAQMTKDDVVVVTGDFGGIWFGDARDDEALGCLESLPFTLAFVDGNHENYDALAASPRSLSNCFPSSSIARSISPRLMLSPGIGASSCSIASMSCAVRVP